MDKPTIGHYASHQRDVTAQEDSALNAALRSSTVKVEHPEIARLRAELEASETELRIVRASQAESNAEVERLRAELAVARADLAVSVGHLSRLANAYGCEDFTAAVDEAALAAKGDE